MSSPRSIRIFFIFCQIQMMAMNCYFDATPPTSADIHDERPILTIMLTGLAPVTPVKIRYWDASGAYTFGHLDLFSDARGYFIQKISLDPATTTVSYMAMSDADNNGILNGSDKGVYRPGIAVSSLFAEDTFDMTTAAALTPVTTVVAQPATGKIYCIYTPNDQLPAHPWNKNASIALPIFPEISATPGYADWIPVSTVDPSNTRTAAYHPNGAYTETCVNDNGDGKLSSGDADI